MKTSKSAHVGFLASGIVAGHIALVFVSTIHTAPIVDEPKQLVAGAFHRMFGRFDLYTVNPPLVKMFASLGGEFDDVELNWSRFEEDPLTASESMLAIDYVERNGAVARRTICFARWICIPFTIVGAGVCFFWSRELYGDWAGLTSLTCWCLSPSILAFAGVILPDLPAAAMGILAAWLWWRWLIQPNSVRLGCAAAALGIALLTKFTLVLLIGIWTIVFVVARLYHRLRSENLGDAPSFSGLCMLLFAAVYLVNLGYGFEGSGRRLGDFTFVSPTLTGLPATHPGIVERGNRFRNSVLATIPVPLPYNFVRGIDIQKRQFDLGSNSYLRGSWSETGWWYYYLYGLLIKIPLPTWALLAWSCIGLPARPSTRPVLDHKLAHAILVITPLVVLFTVSSQSGMSHHLRYVLPGFPFMYVFLGRAAVHARHSCVASAVFLVLMGWLMTAGVRHHAHALTYFNELVGGPRNGHDHLLESNYDWGQDLFRLEKWVAEHAEARPLAIDYYGLTGAFAYGGFHDAQIAEVRWMGDSRVRISKSIGSPGALWLAVSIHNLHTDERPYSELLHRLPEAYIGNSIRVYRLSRSESVTWGLLSQYDASAQNGQAKFKNFSP